jgi:hypothetical protein
MDAKKVAQPIQHPDQYNGKTVKVAAKSASLEAAIFLDYAGGNARISRSRGKSLRSRKSEDAVKWKAQQQGCDYQQSKPHTASLEALANRQQ